MKKELGLAALLFGGCTQYQGTIENRKVTKAIPAIPIAQMLTIDDVKYYDFPFVDWPDMVFGVEDSHFECAAQYGVKRLEPLPLTENAWDRYKRFMKEIDRRKERQAEGK